MKRAGIEIGECSIIMHLYLEGVGNHGSTYGLSASEQQGKKQQGENVSHHDKILFS
jgi:hypothetical protein